MTLVSFAMTAGFSVDRIIRGFKLFNTNILFGKFHQASFVVAFYLFAPWILAIVFSEKLGPVPTAVALIGGVTYLLIVGRFNQKFWSYVDNNDSSNWPKSIDFSDLIIDGDKRTVDYAVKLSAYGLNSLESVLELENYEIIHWILTRGSNDETSVYNTELYLERLILKDLVKSNYGYFDENDIATASAFVDLYGQGDTSKDKNQGLIYKSDELSAEVQLNLTRLYENIRSQEDGFDQKNKIDQIALMESKVIGSSAKSSVQDEISSLSQKIVAGLLHLKISQGVQPLIYVPV